MSYAAAEVQEDLRAGASVMVVADKLLKERPDLDRMQVLATIQTTFDKMTAPLAVAEIAPPAAVAPAPAAAGGEAQLASYINHIKTIFKPSDTLCFVAINHDTNVAKNEFVRFEDALNPGYFQYLQVLNETASVYLGMNSYAPELQGGHTGRTADNVLAIRSLYADVDKDGQAAVAAIRASNDVPTPSIILESSPGKFQTIWPVDGIEDAKPLLKAIAAQFGTDPSVADTARILRVPGLRNRKPAYPDAPLVKVLHSEPTRYSRADFKLEVQPTLDKAEVAPRNEAGLIPHGSIHPQMLIQLSHLANDGYPLEARVTVLPLWVEANCAKPHDMKKVETVARSTSLWKTGLPNKGELTLSQAEEGQAQLMQQQDALGQELLEIASKINSNLLHNATSKAVLQATLANLRKLDMLDSRFPKPLTSASLHGVIGDFVNIAHPTTVASREMICYELLPLIGVILGDSYYLPYGSDRHYASLFALAIGRTADGKGQACNHVKEAMRLLDGLWFKNYVHSDVASGEGLTRMCSNRSLKMPGDTHKNRVAIINTEMATTFAASSRESSTLSSNIRKAYDADQLENYRSAKSKTIVADDYLLGFVGMITPRELRDVMPAMDWSNGAANRFLWSIGVRDKTLGRSTKQPDFTEWVLRVSKLLQLNRDVPPTALDYSGSGRKVWDAWYDSLPEHQDDILSESQARIAANCARVAVLYAQLDERRLNGWKIELDACHVQAAIEIVTRSRQTVEWYLSQQNGKSGVNHDDIQKAKKLMIDKVQGGGAAELTATEVYEAFTHKTKEDRITICLAAGFKIDTKQEEGGQKAVIWK